MSWTMTQRGLLQHHTSRRVAAPCRSAANAKSGRNAAVALVDAVLGWAERARQRRALGALDDIALRDIAVSRADADRELSKPFWRA
jgi:uncharacterized protein YjiS (DUF1127 family)